MKPLPPIRNARIYWRPNRGPDDQGGFYPVCLEDECNNIRAWGTQDAGKPTGEEAAKWLLSHRKERHSKFSKSVGEEAVGGFGGIMAALRDKAPARLYKPADNDQGAP